MLIYLGIYQFGEIEVDFSKLNVKQFPRKKGKTGWMRRIEYRIRVLFGAKVGALQFECIAGDKDTIIGSTTLRFDDGDGGTDAVAVHESDRDSSCVSM